MVQGLILNLTEHVFGSFCSSIEVIWHTFRVIRHPTLPERASFEHQIVGLCTDYNQCNTSGFDGGDDEDGVYDNCSDPKWLASFLMFFDDLSTWNVLTVERVRLRKKPRRPSV